MANSKNYIYRLYLHKNIEKPSEQKGTLRIGNGEEKIKMKIGEAEFELTLNGLKFYRKLYEYIMAMRCSASISRLRGQAMLSRM
jgi:hypothetical protein